MQEQQEVQPKFQAFKKEKKTFIGKIVVVLNAFFWGLPVECLLFLRKR